jgi:hypothetical protein
MYACISLVVQYVAMDSFMMFRHLCVQLQRQQMLVLVRTFAVGGVKLLVCFLSWLSKNGSIMMFPSSI